jgi:hypothetical protein
MTTTDAGLIQRSVRGTEREPKPAPSGETESTIPVDVGKPAASPLAPVPVNIAEAYASSVAVLLIYSHGKDDYGVTGAQSGREPLQLPPRQAPKRRMTGEELTPKDYLDQMTEFSLANREIRTWLNPARDSSQGKLLLIIADHTDLGIPWEMLRLRNSRHEFLGSEITTARWAEAIDDDDEDVVPGIEPDECPGDMVAYIDPDERRKVATSLEVLDPLAWEDHNDLRKFQDLLKTDRDGCGLVYMLCHGFVSENTLEMELGRKDPNCRVRLAELRRLAMRLLDRSRSVVFLNACDTGRATRDQEYLCDYRRRHFSELFLGKRARGVIGTLDKVEVKHAARVARGFLERALKHPELTMAELLRELRAQAVKALDEVPTEAQLDDWFYSFLYVYYGNPLTVLRLKRKGIADA